MAYALRQFHEKDSKGVRAMILAILTTEYPYVKAAYPDTDLESIGSVYGGPRASFFVCEEGGEIIGTVAVKEEDRDTALIRRLFVSPRHRRRGIGSALLEKALQFCREKGYKKACFRSTDRMREAIALCEKWGFREKDCLDMGGFRIHILTCPLLAKSSALSR